jgi:hypothetical protein
MQCVSCGVPREDVGAACPHCGAATPLPARPVPADTRGRSPASGKAVASLVLGLLGVVMALAAPLLGIVLALVAVILGHLARVDIARSDGTVGGQALTSVGLIAGYVVLGMVLVVAVTATVLHP